jgi:hypothetical protein
MQRGVYRFLFGPDQVLGRARRWLKRPNEPFERFVSQSLFQYLGEQGVPVTELVERAATLREKFGVALSLARPLVGVQPLTFNKIHGQPILEAFKFSELPFQGLPLDEQLRTDLQQLRTLEPSTLTNYEGALCTDNKSTRIDIFGSYAPCSPLVFSSLLEPIAQRWSKATVNGSTRQFWRLRRAHRLPAALPMTDTARQATIGGFFVGRLTGRIRIPGEGYASAVEIYDSEVRSWRSFPIHLLTDTAGQRDPRDLLPAVLESMVIAMAQCHADPDLAPLAPYRLMREIYDSTVHGPFSGDPNRITAAGHLARWVAEGSTETGFLPNATNSGAPGDTPEARRAAILAYLSSFQEFVGREYLAPGQLNAPGGGAFSTLDHVPVWDVPLFHEIAPDAYQVLGRLKELLVTAGPIVQPFAPTL